MRVMLEFDPTTGVVKVMSPTSTEGTSLMRPVGTLGVQRTALHAGAYAGPAVGERPSGKAVPITPTATEPATRSAAQDAGAYATGALEERPSVRRQSTAARRATRRESTPPPTIVDRF